MVKNKSVLDRRFLKFGVVRLGVVAALSFNGTLSASVESVAPAAGATSAIGTAPTAPVENTAIATPGEGAPTIAPADDVVTVPAEDAAAVAPVENAPATPAEDAAAVAPVENAPATPAEDAAAVAPVENAPATPAEDAAAVAPVEDAAPVASEKETEATHSDSSSKTIQGRYRLGIGLSQPSFDSSLTHYDELYGHPQSSPALAIDRTFLNWYATIGIGFRLSYYRESGFAGEKKAGGDPDVVTIDRQSDLELTLIPVQAVVSGHIAPFPGRWLILDFWAGPEYLYVQETRHPLKNGDAAAEAAEAVYVNSGWNAGFVTGIGLSLRLDPLDDRGVSTLAILGFRSVYITPFFEVIASAKKTGQFSRKNLGILFTFESML